MSPLTDAREHLAQLLDDLGLPVHVAGPELLTPPSIIIGQATPWVRPHAFGARRVDLTVTITIPAAAGNANALAQLEEVAWSVVQAVPGCGDFDAPETITAGGADALTTRTTVTLTVGDDE